MRKAGRKDANQAEIVAALRAVGVVVLVINQEGVPDLLCSHNGRWTPMEIKRPIGRLTGLQGALRKRAWFPVVCSVDDALAEFGLYAGPVIAK